jgi:hypothetical protein
MLKDASSYHRENKQNVINLSNLQQGIEETIVNFHLNHKKDTNSAAVSAITNSSFIALENKNISHSSSNKNSFNNDNINHNYQNYAKQQDSELRPRESNFKINM